MLLARAKPVSDYFQWPSGVTLQIQCTDLPQALQRELGAFRRVLESNKAADARIVFCRRSNEMPSSKETLRGRYKGIPWKIVYDCPAGGAKSYFFYAPVFSTFLFVRTCLIPILKKTTIEKGGFFLIGSAFASKGTAFIIFGKPGSGKTRLLLDMLEAGGEFLGDSELMLTADKKVLPVFPYVEARLKTLYGTSHWLCLGLKNKVYLWSCHVLSGMSLGRISFNLLLDSADNPWMTQSSSAGPFSRCLVIQLRQGTAEVEPLALQDLLEAIENYETSYQRSFGEGIYTPQLRCLGLSQLKHLLAGAALWKVSSRQRAYDFLQKEMKNDGHSKSIQS